MNLASRSSLKQVHHISKGNAFISEISKTPSLLHLLSTDELTADLWSTNRFVMFEDSILSDVTFNDLLLWRDNVHETELHF